MTKTRFISAALGSSLLLAGCAASTPGPADVPVRSSVAETSASSSAAVPDITVQAVLAVSPAHSITDEDVCLTWGGYAGFDGEIQGLILDASGTIVATGQFGDVAAVAGGCVRTFAAKVPADGSFYTLQVGDRKSDAVAEADLATTNLIVVLDAD